MDAALRRAVRSRAAGWCEYCRMPETVDPSPFEIDHVVAKKHHGATEADNLALACFFCNSHKGANIAGIDAETGQVTPLFSPRRQSWRRHSRCANGTLIGRTPVGRVTIAVLNINDPSRVDFRQTLIAERVFPPADDK